MRTNLVVGTDNDMWREYQDVLRKMPSHQLSMRELLRLNSTETKIIAGIRRAALYAQTPPTIEVKHEEVDNHA